MKYKDISIRYQPSKRSWADFRPESAPFFVDADHLLQAFGGFTVLDNLQV